jgi:hypothetical protein
VTEGNAEAVRVSGVGETTIDIAADLVWIGELLSLTLAVKLPVPIAVGVPEMTPVAAEIERPAGRLPEAIDQM